jgi:hypothetical protein
LLQGLARVSPSALLALGAVAGPIALFSMRCRLTGGLSGSSNGSTSCEE